MSSSNNALSRAPGSPTAGGGEVINVPNALRMKVGPRFGGIDASAVAKAEAALKGLSSQFGQWLQDEIVKLETARAQVKANGIAGPTGDQLYLHSHDLKGLGTTYEFPLITRIAGSLCKLLDEPDKRADAPLFLIDAHIDAIRAAVRSDIRDTANPVGKAIVEELERRVKEFLPD